MAGNGNKGGFGEAGELAGGVVEGIKITQVAGSKARGTRVTCASSAQLGDAAPEIRCEVQFAHGQLLRVRAYSAGGGMRCSK